MTAEHDINFYLFYVDAHYKWGYEVYNTLTDEPMKRHTGYPTMQDARQARFDAAKQIIDDLTN